MEVAARLWMAFLGAAQGFEAAKFEKARSGPAGAGQYYNNQTPEHPTLRPTVKGSLTSQPVFQASDSSGGSRLNSVLSVVRLHGVQMQVAPKASDTSIIRNPGLIVYPSTTPRWQLAL